MPQDPPPTSPPGWSDFFAAQVEHLPAGLRAARVIEEQKRYHFVSDGGPPLLARISGKLRHEATSRADLPSVGDFVVIMWRAGEANATIERVLTRRSKLSRKTAHGDEEQVLCCNVDVALIVESLDTPPNPRRLERFLTVARQGGAQPVLVLSKADLAVTPDTVAAAIDALRAIAGDAPIVVTSARAGNGVDELRGYLGTGKTAVLLGPSGAGKSALINTLHGLSVQSEGPVRLNDGKGRHTTTARSLILLADGSMLIDTPGIRELSLWDAQGDLADAWDDITAIAATCRFRDCRHTAEPGCAVQAAAAAGTLPHDRLAAFLKLHVEAAAQEKQRRGW